MAAFSKGSIVKVESAEWVLIHHNYGSLKERELKDNIENQAQKLSRKAAICKPSRGTSEQVKSATALVPEVLPKDDANAVFGVSGSWIRLLLLHSQQTHRAYVSSKVKFGKDIELVSFFFFL